jgi:4-cresol dehydrogenase (hydroxylating)
MADQQAVINAVTQALDTSRVVSGDSDGASYHKKRYGHLLSDNSLLAMAEPTTIDELKAILELAHLHQFTVWTLPGSSGSAGIIGPSTRDVLLLNLSKMNKIVNVDTVNATALVEPGVTYHQLGTYLKENDIPFWLDCGRNASESVAAGISSRAHGFTPYGDRSMMQCGTEVLLADGLLVRTGMGALPKSDMFQLYKWGYGPVVDGIFMQSNLGVVTKIGLWLMPAPPRYLPFMVTLRDDEALAAAMEALHFLKVNMVIPNNVAIASAEFEASHIMKRGAADSEGLAQAGLGRWNLFGALYGIPENVDILWGMVSGALSAIPGAEVSTGEERGNDPVWASREGLMRGIPPESDKSDLGWGGKERLSITAVGPISGDAGREMADIAGRLLSEAGFPHLIELQVGWRMLLAQVELPFDIEDGSIEHARSTATALLDAWAAAGYAPSHGDAGELHEVVSHAGEGLIKVRSALKEALDPEGLLAG